VRVGQKASIVLRSGRTFEGEVARLGSAADTVTRELEVDVKFSALPNPLVIGEEFEVTIETGRRVALAIPLSAILVGRAWTCVACDARRSASSFSRTT
jgi:hypothetical protein